jgi:hypothetical protein
MSAAKCTIVTLCPNKTTRDAHGKRSARVVGEPLAANLLTNCNRAIRQRLPFPSCTPWVAYSDPQPLSRYGLCACSSRKAISLTTIKDRSES